ncbi:hypothetical protein OEV98_13455 [Caldibacillus lycopersici]|uniref:Uncharacterized protein n=1 Tax=Perspicuibacillus lycopersici TaxID=1325689 RepID=A0AAE3LNC5_9BACI|nr:hypothetical protein [Perspicuibacillus lycopersici]MCU9614545.1 hypothetical protein [Perspicuibacillus lycopersici]
MEKREENMHGEQIQGKDSSDNLSKEEKLNSMLLSTPEIITWMDWEQSSSIDE